MGKNLDRLEFILAFKAPDSCGNVTWSEKSEEELLLHRKDKDGNVNTLRDPLTEQGATQLDKEINLSVAKAVMELPEPAVDAKSKNDKELPAEPIDLDVLIRIASYFGQEMSKWNAAPSAGIFENQGKEFNKFWKSLVEERRRMRGGR